MVDIEETAYRKIREKIFMNVSDIIDNVIDLKREMREIANKWNRSFGRELNFFLIYRKCGKEDCEFCKHGPYWMAKTPRRSQSMVSIYIGKKMTIRKLREKGILLSREDYEIVKIQAKEIQDKYRQLDPYERKLNSLYRIDATKR